jgi:hypothetical protein
MDLKPLNAFFVKRQLQLQLQLHRRQLCISAVYARRAFPNAFVAPIAMLCVEGVFQVI